ncbi:GNAT family N-acetyltransferase [Lysobacter sp. F60174L2]|uniref:GNAT family N-acetyltransferase n=1 Tax=Lysobacter sp. F60174L2 TaxID=3459295 RepID=UPI00403E1E3C
MEAAGPALAEFPAHAAGAAAALARGLRLRAATGGDLPFLRGLYASTRAAELARVPWTEAMRAAFLGDQFALQHRHWLGSYPQAGYLVMEHDGVPVGRCYVDFGWAVRDDALLIDLALLPAAQGRGMGAAVLGHLLQRCERRGQAMVLHVLRANTGAQRLYRRFGFVTESDDGMRLRMRRPPGVAEPAGASGVSDQLNSA